VYVLDPKLQDGKKLPKWTPRACRALYVGVSPDHSSTVGRALNLQTGYVSPQYHCINDDHFLTVNCPVDNVFEGKQFTRQSWERLLELGYERDIDFEDAHGHARPAPELDEQWLTRPERRLREQIRRDRNHLRRFRRAEPASRQQRRVQFAPGTQIQREPPLPREPIPTIPPDGRERQDGATRWNLRDVEWPPAPQNPNVPQDPSDDNAPAPDLDYLSDTTNETDDFLPSDVKDDSDDEGATQPNTTRSGRKSGRNKRLIEECGLAYRPTGFPGRNLRAPFWHTANKRSVLLTSSRSTSTENLTGMEQLTPLKRALSGLLGRDGAKYGPKLRDR
jgi:hypothetical protein